MSLTRIVFQGLANSVTNTINSIQSNTIYTQGIDSTQNSWISSNQAFTQAAYNQANVTAGGLITANANSFYIQSGLNTANANISILFGIESSQNANISAAFSQSNSASANTVYLQNALNTANTNINYSQGVDLAQNNQIQVIQGVDLAQNNQIQVIQGVDLAQNNQIQVIQGVDLAQNNQIQVIQGVDLAQNNQIQVIQGVDLAQNSYIQSVFNTANVGNTFVNTGGTVGGTVTISGGLNVSGNVNVAGSLVTYSSNSVSVQDPIIYLASNNSANVVDLGIVGHFIGGQYNNYQHTGVVRNHLTGNWTFFSNVSTEPSSTVNFAESNIKYDAITTGGIFSPTATINGIELGSYTQASYNQANAISSYANTNIGIIQGVDVTQNSWISSNYNSILVTQGVDVTQNSWISANQVYSQAAYNQANVTAGGLLTANANSTLLFSYVNSANANIISLQTLANTDYTTLTSPAGVYGNSTIVPVITLAANGRVISITNTAITTTGGGGVTASGYLANSIIIANSTGYLSNTSNLQFFSSNNNLYVANNITSNGANLTFTSPLANSGIVLNNQVFTPVYYNTFNGSSTLSYPANTTFQIGTSDFTVEGWFYQTSSGINQRAWGMGTYATSGNFELEMPGNISNYINVHINGSFTTYTNPNGLVLNAWNHIAVVRISGTVTVYFNGVSIGSATQNGGITSASAFYIGGDGGDTAYTGSISNFRIIKGTGIYTSNFIPPKGNLTAVAGTLALTCQNATIVDNSPYAWTLTNNSGVTVSSAITSFSGYSGTYLTWTYDGVGNWVSSGGVNTLGTITSVGSVNIQSTIASTSNTTGALTVAGGVGIKGSLYVGGSLVVLGNTTIENVNITNISVNTTESIVTTGYVNANSLYATTSTGAIYTDNLRYAANGTPWSLGSGGGGITASGYLANSVIVANSTGYLSNTSNLLFYSSNNTLIVANAISVGTSGNTVSNSIYVSGRVGFANNKISVVYQVYNPLTNSLDTIFG